MNVFECLSDEQRMLITLKQFCNHEHYPVPQGASFEDILRSMNYSLLMRFIDFIRNDCNLIVSKVLDEIARKNNPSINQQPAGE